MKTMFVHLYPSDVSGPLGVFHLMRLWLKARLYVAGILSPVHDLFNKDILDKMTLESLGIDPENFLTYIRNQRPSYMTLEDWVRRYPDVKIKPEKGTAVNPAHEHNKNILGTLAPGETVNGGQHNENVFDSSLTVDEVEELRKKYFLGEDQCRTRSRIMWQKIADTYAIHDAMVAYELANKSE